MTRQILLILSIGFTVSLYGQTPAAQGPIFDAQGHLVAYQYADGKRDTYGYDSAWRMISFTGRDGTLTRYIYKSDGTMQAVQSPGKGH